MLDGLTRFFLAWELQSSGAPRRRVSGAEYDAAIYGLCDALQPYSLIGLHCTRLTEQEIEHIIAHGMQLPNGAMLAARIDRLVADGVITAEVAERLTADNGADEPSRANKLWFCFFRPGIAGESGIGSFFRFWGGEALYRSHDGVAVTGVALARIGIPCLIDAEVPISSLRSPTGLAFKIVRRYLIYRGYETSEPVDHEDHAVVAIPANLIRRIIRYPEPEFLELTGSEGWRDTDFVSDSPAPGIK